jgi:spore coat polysaccharide biosynthesis predicted glycosyltransferase SpsG
MKTTPARFLFRLAAGPRIGFGHLMRCRALARALHVRPLVSIRGGAGARRTARAIGCDLADGTALCRTDLLIVDDPSPRHARTWLLRATRAGRPAATIHDLRTGDQAADLVVDGRVTARPSRRGGTALRGPRFTVLDPGVAAARAARRPHRATRRPRVLIALGGGSHIFAVVQPLVADIARRCPGVTITVAAGFCRQSRPALRGARWIGRPDGLTWDLAESDVAVVGGGVTLYEACAIGAPAVALAVVPAQRAAIRAFAARGAAIDAGALADGVLAAGRAAAAVAGLLGDAPARRRCSAAARRLIDGRGALRVAARMRSLARTAAQGRGTRV